MTKKSLIILGAAAVLILGASCGRKSAINANFSVNDNESIANERELENGNVNVTVGDNENDNSNANANENANRNDNTNTDIAGEEGPTINSTLRVDNPQIGKKLESPFEVEGKSQAETVYVRIKNASGLALFTVSAKVRGGEFHLNLTYSFTHTTTGTVEVFERDSAGAEVSPISIPVTFRIDSQNENVSNTNDNENTNENENENTNENANDNENDNVNTVVNTNY